MPGPFVIPVEELLDGCVCDADSDVLRGQLRIGNACYHVEAVPVVLDPDAQQVATSPLGETLLDDAASAGSGWFDTVLYKGTNYVVLLAPYRN